MKQLILGIFAHPDDEAFGPAGTLVMLNHQGYDVHLLVLTDGEGGTNPTGAADLGALRLAEWHRAGEALGTRSQTALHFPDGALETVDEQRMDQAIRQTIRQILANHEEEIEVSLMTFEPDGLTGHRDHIVASKAAMRAFKYLKELGVARGSLWQFCLDHTQAPLDGTAYYEPRAREDAFITHRVDVRPFLAQKYVAMDCHVSQVADAQAMKKLGDDLLATECFHVISN